MKFRRYLKNVRSYALISFLLPLVTLNVCLFLYKALGSINIYPDFNTSEKRVEYSAKEYLSISYDDKSNSFTNCPIYKIEEYYITLDNQLLAVTAEMEIDENKHKSVIRTHKNIIDDRCVKNHKFKYLLLNNFKSLEKILIESKVNNPSGFVNVKNPYFNGEVSISRTARYFPATLIFKPFIILSAIFLFLYWKNNLNLFKELKDKNILNNFSEKFFYFGILSSIFLILHASFLGIDYESKLFTQIRRIIIVSFIIFELLAQILLTRNLIRLKNDLKNYINLTVLKLKIIFVSIIFFITCFVFSLLAFGDLSTPIKHALEWNYFSVLLFFYLLSRLLWKNTKTQVHTPEGV